MCREWQCLLNCVLWDPQCLQEELFESIPMMFGHLRWQWGLDSAAYRILCHSSGFAFQGSGEQTDTTAGWQLSQSPP